MLIQKLRGKVDHIDHEKGRLFLNVGVSNRCIVLDWNKDYEPVDEIMSEVEVGIDEVLEIHCEINGTEWLGYNDGNRLKGEIFSVKEIDDFCEIDNMDLTEIENEMSFVKQEIKNAKERAQIVENPNKQYISDRKRQLRELRFRKRQLETAEQRPDEL